MTLANIPDRHLLSKVLGNQKAFLQAGLTGRSFEVLQLLMRGKSQADVSRILGISRTAVFFHVARLVAGGFLVRLRRGAYALATHVLRSVLDAGEAARAAWLAIRCTKRRPRWGRPDPVVKPPLTDTQKEVSSPDLAVPVDGLFGLRKLNEAYADAFSPDAIAARRSRMGL